MANLEIEKRFLCKNTVLDALKKDGISYAIFKLEQFYLLATKEETLRYRKDCDSYIKNIKKGSGLVREEIESRVTKKEYKKAKRKNSGGIIKKDRYKFFVDGNMYEFDQFKGKLKGLSILEIEFKNIYEATEHKIPEVLKPFIIKEITKESIYSNGALSLSMKIPLRKDSFLSLIDIKKSNSIYKPSFDLYISDYENIKYAFKNSLDRLLISYQLNFKKFKENLNLSYLYRVNKALFRVKTILKLHKKFIKKSSYEKIFFNINALLLEFEKLINTHKTFKLLINKKSQFLVNMQNIVLKELIVLAQKEKKLKRELLNRDIEAYTESLKKSTKELKYKDIDKPFYFLKDIAMNRATKRFIKAIKSDKNIDRVMPVLEESKIVLKYFKANMIKKNKYKKYKDSYLFNLAINYIENREVKKYLKDAN